MLNEAPKNGRNLLRTNLEILSYEKFVYVGCVNSNSRSLTSPSLSHGDILCKIHFFIYFFIFDCFFLVSCNIVSKRNLLS